MKTNPSVERKGVTITRQGAGVKLVFVPGHMTSSALFDVFKENPASVIVLADGPNDDRPYCRRTDDEVS